MLGFLRGRLSERKMRLFACVCVRCCWALMPDERGPIAISVAEAFADGLADLSELQAACFAAADSFL
jgi:hypothetical protein